MTAVNLQHRRTHNLLLISRLLSCRDQISPFTLVLDSLHQSGWPLIQDMMARAKTARVHVVFLAFETLRRPAQADVVLRCHGKAADEVQLCLGESLHKEKRNLVVLDTLHPLLALDGFDMTVFLSMLMMPTTSVLATYHTAIPVVSSSTSPSTTTASASASASAPASAYSPTPLSLLRYLATAIITTHALKHITDKRHALNRSTAPPLLGLDERLDGAVVALGSNDARGTVLELEHRRRSGRTVVEWFYVAHRRGGAGAGAGAGAGVGAAHAAPVLLEDHPEYPSVQAGAGAGEAAGEHGSTTFELGLSAEQRRERDKVVLPYFDAQSADGVGQGGRILYDLGAEDDFDEEEDEI